MPHQKSLQLNPKKLLLSKWTATIVQNKEKHFLVTKIIEPELPFTQIQDIELEAIYSGRSFILPWQELTNTRQWRQGWL